jgi:AcrR family transcriptional regulator
MSRYYEILDAARRLFYARGYEAVGVDAIGAEVGIAGPSIYTHFRYKAEILAALFDESMDRMLQLAGPPREDPRQDLEHLVRAHAVFAVEERELLTIYTREERSLRTEGRRRFRRRESSYLDRWVTPLEQLHPDRSRQELRSGASAVIGMLMSVTSWPRDALRTPNLPDLLAELALGALALAPVSVDSLGLVGVADDGLG